MAKKQQKKKQFKAFKIVANFTFPGGRNYRKRDFYRAETASEEENLTRAMFAVELADDAKEPAPPPRVASAPPPAAAPAPAIEETVSDELDWNFMTKTAMRVWLDKSGVALPSQQALKGTYEQLCRDAWAAGRRPDPLYGFPGGPEPSPGLPGPVVNAKTLAEAIEAGDAAATVVPDEARNALKELMNPPEPPAPPAPEAAKEDAQEGPSAGADEANEGDAGEDASDDESASEVLPEGETEFPVPSGATADTPADSE